MIDNQLPDVVIVGGGAAGSSAALVLGRARARATLIDAGQPSNAPSTRIGGLLGSDGTAPTEFYQRAATEIAAYESVTRRSALVTSIHHHGTPRWRVELDSGDGVLTDRILLATGMHYALPDIEGIEPFWGASVFHCPFCHGWEHRDQPLAVAGSAMGTVERTLLLRRWTDDITLITDNAVLDDTERHQLKSADVRILDGHIASLLGSGRHLDSITLTDGTTVAATGLLVPAPHQSRHPSLFDQLDLDTNPTGHLMIDDFGATSVPGIWAAGDLTTPFANVARAIAQGSNSAVAITRDLVTTQHAPEIPPS